MTEPAAVRPMEQGEYEAWLARELEGYAADLARATGATPGEARARAGAQLRELLGDGLRTEGHHLLRVVDADGAPVGTLWIGPHPQRAGAGWVWEIQIDEHRRGEGFGRAAMLAAERVCREAGWDALGLNVFSHNPRARALYDSLGFEVVATAMSKAID